MDYRVRLTSSDCSDNTFWSRYFTSRDVAIDCYTKTKNLQSSKSGFSVVFETLKGPGYMVSESAVIQTR